MTPRATDRPLISVEEFEELERHAPEHVWLEFINGRIVVKPMPDGNHSEIIAWLQRQCLQQRPDFWLHAERGVKAERYRRGRARADGFLVLEGGLKGHGEWSDPEGALMVVEITSYDSDTNRRDRIEKPDGYAAAGIPVYLLIDRDDCSVTVYADPEGGRYRRQAKEPFGADVKLPDPVAITLNTEKLKDYAD
ncbi:Uma2 family endonuclease [Streptomyces sp. NPDC055189]